MEIEGRNMEDIVDKTNKIRRICNKNPRKQKSMISKEECEDFLLNIYSLRDIQMRKKEIYEKKTSLIRHGEVTLEYEYSRAGLVMQDMNGHELKPTSN